MEQIADVGENLCRGSASAVEFGKFGGRIAHGLATTIGKRG